MTSCARCNKKLGLRKITPKLDWQIKGKICTECNKHICENTSYYEAEYKENELDFPKQKGTLAIQNFDNKRRILFIAKETIQFEILLQAIQKFENIDYTEKSTKKKISTLGLKDKSTSKMIENGYSELEELHNFRNWISVFRDNIKYRCDTRRNGQVGLGPLTLEGRGIN